MPGGAEGRTSRGERRPSTASQRSAQGHGRPGHAATRAGGGGWGGGGPVLPGGPGPGLTGKRTEDTWVGRAPGARAGSWRHFPATRSAPVASRENLRYRDSSGLQESGKARESWKTGESWRAPRAQELREQGRPVGCGLFPRILTGTPSARQRPVCLSGCSLTFEPGGCGSGHAGGSQSTLSHLMFCLPLPPFGISKNFF